MNTREILVAAREKISAPERWTQFVGARTDDGYATYWGDPEAVCWCALGAVSAIDDRQRNVAVQSGAIKALQQSAGSALTEYNDTHTHADVLALFDCAIAALREGEQ